MIMRKRADTKKSSREIYVVLASANYPDIGLTADQIRGISYSPVEIKKIFNAVKKNELQDKWSDEPANPYQVIINEENDFLVVDLDSQKWFALQIAEGSMDDQ